MMGLLKTLLVLALIVLACWGAWYLIVNIIPSVLWDWVQRI